MQGRFLIRRLLTRVQRLPVWNVVVAVFVLSGLLVGSVWAMGSRPPAAGMPASEFSLMDLDGKSHKLEQYRG